MKDTVQYLIISIIYCFGILNANAQAPTWDWAKTAGGADSDVAYSVANDASGNVIVAGYFISPTITFGSNTLSNQGEGDVFLVKYDATGNVLWAKSAGSGEFDAAKSVIADDLGNIYIAGYFTSPTITFGNFTLTNTTLTFRDVFVVKYDASGNVLWAESAGGIYHDQANDIATDAVGNIVVTGYFLADTITFGGNNVFTSGSYDMFIVKYDASGNVLWARGEGGSDDDRGECVTADDFGNVMIGGAFKSATLTIGTTTLTWAGGAYSDIFLVKYDDAGNVIWVEGAGGDYLDEPDDITADAAGNIYMSGIMYSTYMMIGSDSLVNSGFTFYGDMFIAKFDSSGTPQWAQCGGHGQNNDWGGSVTIDGAGDLLMTGLFGSTITLDTITLSNGSGLFVAKYNPAGNIQWAIEVPNGVGSSIVADNNGNMYVAGYHWDNSITFGSTTLTNVGGYDMFVAKLVDLTVANNTPDDIEHPVNVFPNPFSTSAMITFSNEASELFVADIYNMEGKIVRTISTTNSQLVFHRQQLAPGLYFLQLKTANEVIATRKLLVE